MNTLRAIETRFASWLLLGIFLLVAVGYNALMGSNHGFIVGVGNQFAESAADLPDARYWFINADHLWTADEIRAWAATLTAWQLSEYRLHNAVAFQVFVLFACIQWSLTALLISPHLRRVGDALLLLPIVILVVKLIEVVGIYQLLKDFENAAPGDLATLATVAAICTGAKLWLFMTWWLAFALAVIGGAAFRLRTV